MNRNYGQMILDAKRLLARGVYEDAADSAMMAMDVALYEMMEPVTSQYVQSAKKIRDQAFTLQKIERRFEKIPGGY